MRAEDENVKCFKRLPIFIVEETVNAKFQDFKIHEITENGSSGIYRDFVECLSRFLSYLMEDDCWEIEREFWQKISMDKKLKILLENLENLKNFDWKFQ